MPEHLVPVPGPVLGACGWMMCSVCRGQLGSPGGRRDFTPMFLISAGVGGLGNADLNTPLLRCREAKADPEKKQKGFICPSPLEAGPGFSLSPEAAG